LGETSEPLAPTTAQPTAAVPLVRRFPCGIEPARIQGELESVRRFSTEESELSALYAELASWKQKHDTFDASACVRECVSEARSERKCWLECSTPAKRLDEQIADLTERIGLVWAVLAGYQTDAIIELLREECP
jgi:hypothetical protein